MSERELDEEGLKPTPVDDIQSLVHQSSSYEASEFNKEVFNLIGRWSLYEKENADDLGSTVLRMLEVSSANDEVTSIRVSVETDGFKISKSELEYRTLDSTTFYDLAMTSFDGTVGLVFITDGDLQDDINEGLFVPSDYSSKILIASRYPKEQNN